jgi:hypothetical protein
MRKLRQTENVPKMTSEFRIIKFEHKELGTALAAHTTAQGTHPLVDMPTELRIDIDRTSITAKWRKTSRHADLTVTYETPDVCQALIRFCKSQHIPLPVKSKKAVCVLDGRITLLIEQSRPSTAPLIPMEYTSV